MFFWFHILLISWSESLSLLKINFLWYYSPFILLWLFKRKCFFGVTVCFLTWSETFWPFEYKYSFDIITFQRWLFCAPLNKNISLASQSSYTPELGPCDLFLLTKNGNSAWWSPIVMNRFKAVLAESSSTASRSENQQRSYKWRLLALLTRERTNWTVSIEDFSHFFRKGRNNWKQCQWKAISTCCTRENQLKAVLTANFRYENQYETVLIEDFQHEFQEGDLVEDSTNWKYPALLTEERTNWRQRQLKASFIGSLEENKLKPVSINNFLHCF